MTEWQQCMAREADEFAAQEERDAPLLAMMQAQWEALQPHEVEGDEWDECEYSYGD